MKVLLYTYDIMKIGGIEASFYNLAIFLKANGYDVGVRFTTGDTMRIKHYQDAGIDIQPAHEETCDILIIGSVFHIPNKLIVGKVVAQQVHADWTDVFWGEANSAIELIKRAEPDANLFLPVSKSSCEFVKRYTNKPVRAMYNLAPFKQPILRKKHKKLVIASFTRMTAEKGLNNYVALQKHLKKLGIDAELRCYTNGEVPNGWTAVEPVPNITTELTDVDFVASLADTESFGYTIAEANSCGVPCIIKRTNSTAEFHTKANNLIIDRIDELTAKDLRRTIKVDYKLRVATEKNILATMKHLEGLARGVCIIRTMKTFTDLEIRRERRLGEVFAVNNERAKVILNHPSKIAREA